MGTHLRAMGRHLPCGITVLPATRHKWMHPTLTPTRQAGTQLPYPGGMEGWVELGSLIVAWLGIEPMTTWLQVRCRNCYAAKLSSLMKSKTHCCCYYYYYCLCNVWMYSAFSDSRRSNTEGAWITERRWHTDASKVVGNADSSKCAAFWQEQLL